MSPRPAQTRYTHNERRMRSALRATRGVFVCVLCACLLRVCLLRSCLSRACPVPVLYLLVLYSVVLSLFVPCFAVSHLFVLIFCPHLFVLTLSSLCPHFVLTLSSLCPHLFVLTLSSLVCPHFVLTLFLLHICPFCARLLLGYLFCICFVSVCLLFVLCLVGWSGDVWVTGVTYVCALSAVPACPMLWAVSLRHRWTLCCLPWHCLCLLLGIVMGGWWVMVLCGVKCGMSGACCPV